MKMEIWNSRHVERHEELEVCAGILSSLERVVDLIGLPVVGTDVEGKGINSMIMGKLNVLQPGIRGVGIGVAHHMVGSNNLGVAIPLRNYRNKIAEQVREIGVGRRGGTIPEPSAYLAIGEWEQLRQGGPW